MVKRMILASLAAILVGVALGVTYLHDMQYSLGPVAGHLGVALVAIGSLFGLLLSGKTVGFRSNSFKTLAVLLTLTVFFVVSTAFNLFCIKFECFRWPLLASITAVLFLFKLALVAYRSK
jgi:hypothetical protein